jgi:hypothetical protein
MKASPESSDLRQIDLNDCQPVQKPATSPLSAAMLISAVPLYPSRLAEAGRARREAHWVRRRIVHFLVESIA